MAETDEFITVIDDAELNGLSARPSIGTYIADLWKRRHFIWYDARSRAFASGRDMYLGRAWIIIQPILDSMVYILIFGVVLKLSRNIDFFIGYLVLGVIFFGFINRGIGAGSGLIQSSKGMISSFKFPKAALAVSVIMKQFLDNVAPALVGLTIAMGYHRIVPSWTIIAVVPLYFLVHAFALGAMLIVARITAFIPDLKALVSTILRAMFFVSGVFFDIHRFDSNETLQQIMLANPVFQFLTAIREASIYQTFPPAGRWAYLLAWTLVLLVGGIIYFWRAEERYANVR